jgi:hypothetical protein
MQRLILAGLTTTSCAPDKKVLQSAFPATSSNVNQHISLATWRGRINTKAAGGFSFGCFGISRIFMQSPGGYALAFVSAGATTVQ